MTAYIDAMKRILLTLAALSTIQPASAEDQQGRLDGFFAELQKQLDSFTQEVGPMMQDFSEELAPLLGELQSGLSQLNAYHPPEILPNGDIIIRRKTPPITPTDPPNPAQPEKLPGPDAIDI